MSKDQFVKMYQEFFPHGDASHFAVNIFRTFDDNKDGKSERESLSIFGLKTLNLSGPQVRL